MTATAGSGTRPGSGLPAAARPRRRRPGLVLALAGLTLVVALLAGVWVGALPLAPGAVVATLLDRLLGPLGIDVPGGLSGTEEAVLLQLRLPRVLLAALIGAGLAIAGAAYQGVFRNPLADPYLLGAAAGAGLGATLAIAYSPVQSIGPVGIAPWAPRRWETPRGTVGDGRPAWVDVGPAMVEVAEGWDRAGSSNGCCRPTGQQRSRRAFAAQKPRADAEHDDQQRTDADRQIIVEAAARPFAGQPAQFLRG